MILKDWRNDYGDKWGGTDYQMWNVKVHKQCSRCEMREREGGREASIEDTDTGRRGNCTGVDRRRELTMNIE